MDEKADKEEDAEEYYDYSTVMAKDAQEHLRKPPLQRYSLKTNLQPRERPVTLLESWS